MNIFCHGGTCPDKGSCTRFLFGFGRGNIVISPGTNKETCQYYSSVISVSKSK